MLHSAPPFYHICFTEFFQLNELGEELRCERAEKQLNVHRSSETEGLISSLTTERDQFRTEVQENGEMVGNCKTCYCILKLSPNVTECLSFSNFLLVKFLFYHFRTLM